MDTLSQGPSRKSSASVLLKETVLITGASGLVGRHLSNLLMEKGYRVLTLSRHPKGKGAYHWDPENNQLDTEALSQTDHVIHLAGASIGDGRWTDARKKEILDSRVQSCTLLFRKCQESGVRLKTFVTASAVGYYGTSERERAYTENDPAGTGFLAEVCQKWEQAADNFQKVGVRTVKIRTGIVLSTDGGILPQMTMPVRMGFGLAFGNGKQCIPWIHIQDMCNIYLKAVQDQSWQGAYNAVSPESATNASFTKQLARHFHKSFWPLSVPAFPLKMVMGERSELLLKGSDVKPMRLTEQAFDFRYTNLKAALSDLYPVK